MQAMNGASAFALFMEMRTGKTKTILDEFGTDEANGEIANLLVVAPAGVYLTWKDDARKHLSDDLNKRVMIAHWESGPTAAQTLMLKAFMKFKGPRILLVNVEALSRVLAAKNLVTTYLGQQPTTMVVDESTTIKGPDAARTKFCISVAPLAKKRRILSGLPTPQSPLDIFSQFQFLDPNLLGYKKYTAFEQRYAVIQQKPFGPGGRMVNDIVGYQNLDELQRRVAQHSYRVKLGDCYDLPPKMYLRRDVEMTPQQKTAYAEMKKYAVAELENAERVTATIVLVQMLRLHQILCGHTMSDDGNVAYLDENKTVEMLDILKQHSGKAIIWAAYDQSVRLITTALEEAYGKGTVSRFWGGNADTREAEEKAFKTLPKRRFMVATAAAGGRGRTWDMANVMIYHANTFSLEHRLQSEERNQGVGKTESVGVFDLVVRGSIEEKIIAALRDKMKLSDAITGDNWRDWIE